MSAPHDKSGPTPAASTDHAGGAAGQAGRGGHVEAGQREQDDDDTWRHEPVVPVDEQNPLKSIGRAVADALTGDAEAQAKAGKPEH